MNSPLPCSRFVRGENHFLLCASVSLSIKLGEWQVPNSWGFGRTCKITLCAFLHALLTPCIVFPISPSLLLGKFLLIFETLGYVRITSCKKSSSFYPMGAEHPPPSHHRAHPGFYIAVTMRHHHAERQSLCLIHMFCT